MSNKTDLVVAQLTKAGLALLEAKTVQDTKQVLDVASAAEIYAKRQHLSQDAIDYAHDIKIQALAQLGKQLKSTPMNEGGRPAKTGAEEVPVLPAPVLPTLEEIGLTKKESALAQKLATMADESPDLFEDVRSGLLSMTKAAAKVANDKNAELKKNAPPLPKGQYGCIVIDPPWQMEKIEREVAPNQVAFDYPTMDESELSKFDVSGMAGPDCHLFCWTTHKHLPLALRLLEAWGFRYVCTMVWHKSGGFQPFGLPQYNCEFVLYARRGTPVFVDTKAFNCCFNGGRREHSRKPDEFYDVIKRVTDGPRIDVFSRELRDGFDQFGNEVDKFA